MSELSNHTKVCQLQSLVERKLTGYTPDTSETSSRLSGIANLLEVNEGIFNKNETKILNEASNIIYKKVEFLNSVLRGDTKL